MFCLESLAGAHFIRDSFFPPHDLKWQEQADPLRVELQGHPVNQVGFDLLRDSLCMVARQYNHQATLYGTSTIHRQNKLLYKAYGEVKADSFAVNV